MASFQHFHDFWLVACWNNVAALLPFLQHVIEFLGAFLDFFHEIDVLFGLNSFVFLVEDFYFFDFVLIEFDFGFEMDIFFPELFHFLDDFFNFNSVFFGGNFIVDFFDLSLNFLDLFVDLFDIVFLDLEFFFELELCVEELFIDLDAGSLIFFDTIIMFKFGIIEWPKLIKHVIKL